MEGDTWRDFDLRIDQMETRMRRVAYFSMGRIAYSESRHMPLALHGLKRYNDSMKRGRFEDKMRRRISLSGIAFLVLAFLVAACGSASEPGDAATSGDGFTKNSDGYADITAKQLAKMMPVKDFTLVNVHIPHQGEIPETDLFIPFDEVAQNVDQLPDKDAPIVLYCRSGSMSTTAAKTLADLGYTNILEVDGGFNAWKDAGYELKDTSL